MKQQTAITTTSNPHFLIDLRAIDRAGLGKQTTAKYKTELQRMTAAGVSPMDADQLAEYADGLKSSRKAFLKAGLNIITREYERKAKGSATPENIGQVIAAVYRLEAMRGAVKVKARNGDKAHNWLSKMQVKEMTALCEDTARGRRDWVVLGLLLGAGLRREELAALEFTALKQQPRRGGGMRDILEVTGKGEKTRVIPISGLLARRIRAWRDEVGGGYIARSVNKGGRIGGALSAVGIFKITAAYGDKIGAPGLAPHDLRRTYAQIAYDAGIPITQISVLLGHSSVTTTQKYLNLALDIETTASDFIPLSGD